ncbi:uncharacterized protein [Ptychodera flava]|uniref:uncharacterized protein n=1 Tax=Ptychodera flava TaxID=63121 RepID=UPI003969EDB4
MLCHSQRSRYANNSNNFIRVISGDDTSGNHPDYEFSNTFDDVVVEKDEIVTCRLTPGDDEIKITAEACLQPVLTNSPWLTDISKSEMTVHWDAWDSSVDVGDEPVEMYEVWYKVSGENDFTPYDTTEDQTSLPVTALTPYTSYTFAVKTYRPGAGGGGDLSPEVTDQTLCDVPLGQPIIEEANTLSDTEISVSWKEARRSQNNFTRKQVIDLDSSWTYVVLFRLRLTVC